MESAELEGELEKQAKKTGGSEPNKETEDDLALLFSNTEEYQKRRIKKLEKERIEHEQISQAFLQEAEQAETGQDLYRLFLDAKAWHHQIDLLEWSAKNINGKKLDFLVTVVKNLKNIANIKEPEGFYEDPDYVFHKSGKGSQESYRKTDFETMLNNSDWLEGYEEYLISNLAGALKEYNSEEFRGQAEDILFQLLERLKSINQEFSEWSRESAETAQNYPLPELSEEDEALEIEYDLQTTEREVEGFGWAEGPFNGTFVDVVRSLQEVGSEKSIRPLVDLIKYEPNALTGVIADAFSKISSEKATAQLLPLLKDEDHFIRRGVAKVLYRLEFGQIGISEEGVKYLERMYDLGEDNNPDYFVQRLTAEGDIGVFNEKRELFKYFNLGDLNAPEKKIKAHVLDFTYETLFRTKDDESPEERKRRELVLEEFKKKYFDFYGQDFFKQTNLHFNNLSFREQGWYLHFAINASDEQKQKAFDFVRRYGEDGFRAFLSMEYGDEMGEKILKIGENLPDNAARLIFSKYAKIVESAQEVEKYARKKFGLSQGLPEKSLIRISENLMAKGKDLLVDFSDRQLLDQNREDIMRGVLRDLSNVKTEILLFANTLREAAKSKDFSVEDFLSKSIEIVDSARIPDNDKKQMIEMFMTNWKDQKISEDLLASDFKEFKQVLNETGHEFRILKHDDQIIAFLRFDKLPNGNIYAGSFNLSPGARGTSVAIAMGNMSIREFSKGHNIEALCYSSNKSLLAYYKRMLGFKEVGRIDEGDPYRECVKLVLPKFSPPQKLEKAA